MKRYTDSSLKKYNTFGLEHIAKEIIEIEDEKELENLLPLLKNERVLLVGSGSNLLFTKPFDGHIICMKTKGKKLIQESENQLIIEVSAGENWHDFVDWTLTNSYFGLENLALIPGTVGASPVQNIGAYGVEAKDFIDEVLVFDIETSTWKWFSNEECGFEYRNSHFKRHLGRYIVAKVRFKLSKTENLKLNYGKIRQELEKHNQLEQPTARQVFEAVIAIRSSKLPDPQKVGNAGSFFKNPVIDANTFEVLQKKFPKLVHYLLPDGKVKLAAGWLIEHLGWKGKTYDGYGVYPEQSLILVNYHLTEGQALKDLALKIQSDVYQNFNIKLEPEVQLF
ncbi:MAG: UDP-N-acetylmuramate dehydrogenase [Flavobacteriales bacterium]